eukprot:1153646-Pelagomonas_calceolata.AAC.3
MSTGCKTNVLPPLQGEEDLCYKVARSIALLIDPPSPYECLLGRLSDEQDAADAFAKGIPANGANKPKVLQLKSQIKLGVHAHTHTHARTHSLRQHARRVVWRCLERMHNCVAASNSMKIKIPVMLAALEQEEMESLIGIMKQNIELLSGSYGGGGDGVQ